MSFPPETPILIGKRLLSTAEAMTVRVAHMGHRSGDVTTVEEARKCFATVRAFKAQIEADGPGDDETGIAIADGYIYHAGTVLQLLQRSFGPLAENE